MSDDTVSVKFGADTSQLTAQIAIAKAQLASVNAEIRALAKEMIATGSAADEGLTAKLSILTGAASAVKGHLSDLSSGLETSGGHAKIAGGGISFYANELRALADEAASGRWRNFDGSLLRLATHGAQAAASFVAANPALTAFGAAAAAAAAAVGYLVFEEVEFTRAQGAVQAQEAINQFKGLGEAASATVTAISQAADVSYSDAAKINAAFAPLGPGGEQLAKIASLYIPMYVKATGEDAVKAGEKLANTWVRLSTDGKRFVNETVDSSGELRKQFSAFEAAHDSAGMYATVLAAMKLRLEEGREGLEKQDAAVRSLEAAMMDATAAGTGFLGLQESLREQSDITAANIDKQRAAIQQWTATSRQEFAKSPVVANNTAAETDKIIEKTNQYATKLKEVSAEIELLEGRRSQFDPSKSLDYSRIREIDDALMKLRADQAELQEKSGDGILGRDAFTRAQDQIRNLEQSFKGLKTTLLGEEISILTLSKQGNNAPSGSKEALQFDQEIAAKRKELAEASSNDYAHAEEMKTIAAGNSTAARIAQAQHEAAEKAKTYGLGSDEFKAADAARARVEMEAAQQQVEIRRKQIEDEIKAEQDKTKQLISSDQDAVKRRTLTQADASAQIIARYGDEKKAVDSLYAEMGALADRTGLKQQDAADRLAQYNRAVTRQIRREQQQAAEATQKYWDTTANQIESAFNSQLRGLLEGTTNWATAGKRILEDFVIQAIEGFEKMAVNFVLQQTVMNTSATVGSNIRIAADQASAAGGIAALAANALKAITVDAGQTAAGVTAFMAPFVGPAAIGVGEAAGAQVMGLSALGGIYDTGSWSVPRDMVAGLHAGEVVIPQRGGLADQFRDIAAGGGFGQGGGGGRGGPVSVNPSTHFHVNAVDGASAAQFFRNNGREIMKAVDEAVRHGAHLGARRLAGV